MKPSKMMKKKAIIGITGTIASGKSTVTGYLSEKYGVFRIDADKVGHEVLTFPSVIRALCEAFGTSFLDAQGQVIRRELGKIVFSDPGKLQTLNAITHPVIIRTIQDRLDAFQHDPSDAPFGMVEAIELLRTPLKGIVDECWVIWAQDDIRIQRIMNRDHLSEEEARNRVLSQWPQEEYMKAADRLIDGGRTLDELYPELDRMVESLKKQVPASPSKNQEEE